MEWIKNLKVGDKVLTLERNVYGVWKWESEVISTANNYIETLYRRDENNEMLTELVAKLAPNHRTYMRQWVKNYFGPDGSINIEEIK